MALGSKGSSLILNGKLSQVSAEEAYTHLTTPVFGKEVVFDVPNSIFMEQKKFVKVGLSTENMKVYVDQITDEYNGFLATDSKFQQLKKTGEGKVDIFKSMCELTILTASRTLQGREVREGLDKSFADLYHDLDSGFTPINFVIPNLPLPNNFKRDRAQKKMSDFYRGICKKRREEGVLDVSNLLRDSKVFCKKRNTRSFRMKRNRSSRRGNQNRKRSSEIVNPSNLKSKWRLTFFPFNSPFSFFGRRNTT